MLDIIIELIIDIFFVASDGTFKDKRIPGFIRYPLMIISAFVSVLLVVGPILFGINCLQEGRDTAGYMLIVLGVLLAVFVIVTFSLAYKRKDEYVVTNSEGQRRDFEIISKDTPINNNSNPKSEVKSTGILGRIVLFLFIVSILLIFLLLTLSY